MVGTTNSNVKNIEDESNSCADDKKLLLECRLDIMTLTLYVDCSDIDYLYGDYFKVPGLCMKCSDNIFNIKKF